MRSKYHKYICKDCNNQREDNEPLDPVPTVDRPSSPDREPVPMEYSTPIPVTLCKIGRREQDRTSNKKPEYGPYSFDYKHECVLEIQKLRNGAQWATTRSIIIRPSRDGSPEDECRWLAPILLVNERLCLAIRAASVFRSSKAGWPQS